jgi:hypothetical protein
VSVDERPLSAVPGWLRGLLAATLAFQFIATLTPWPGRFASDLPPPPSADLLRVASLGEPAAASRLAILWLQSFDSQSINQAPYRKLDYARLIGWLAAIVDTDPRSRYPLFVAARVYAEVPDRAKMRQMLEFVAREYPRAPLEHWPAMAHAALLAKHRLGDLALARRYAVALQPLAKEASVPLWAKQMEVFILEDMNELEAARIMLGGLLASGQIQDPEERRLMQGRLQDLKRRAAAKR